MHEVWNLSALFAPHIQSSEGQRHIPQPCYHWHVAFLCEGEGSFEAGSRKLCLSLQQQPHFEDYRCETFMLDVFSLILSSWRYPWEGSCGETFQTWSSAEVALSSPAETQPQFVYSSVMLAAQWTSVSQRLLLRLVARLTAGADGLLTHTLAFLWWVWFYS